MNIHETLLRDCARDPGKAVEHLKALAAELQEAFPKLLVVVGSYRGVVQLDETLRRIPADLIPLIEEIAVFGVFSEDFSEGSSEELKRNPAWG
jgi:hypothetical protein